MLIQFKFAILISLVCDIIHMRTKIADVDYIRLNISQYMNTKDPHVVE